MAEVAREHPEPPEEAAGDLHAAGPPADLGADSTPVLSGSKHELVDALGSQLYETAVTQGWIDETDPAFTPGTPERAAIDLLTELGVLRYDDHARRFHPVDPAGASDQLVVPLAQQGSELLQESARWSTTFERLRHLYRSSSLSMQRTITEVHGFEAINRYIDAQLTDCRTELLTAQPHGKRRASTLKQVEQRDLQALSRGVSMRTLYQHSARHSPATREYVADISALGAQVRTSDEFFKRLIIFDRHTALIPGTENRAVAVAIHDKSVVTYLVDIFDRAWERALPFTVEGLAVARTVAGEVRAMTLRMLVEGHSDAASAKRLGVSPRTYASYISALKEEYGVETRFQLGWAMSQSQDSVEALRAKPDDQSEF
jgi:sugar-specific transcriptional regulator TrmB